MNSKSLLKVMYKLWKEFNSPFRTISRSWPFGVASICYVKTHGLCSVGPAPSKFSVQTFNGQLQLTWSPRQSMPDKFLFVACLFTLLLITFTVTTICLPGSWFRSVISIWFVGDIKSAIKTGLIFSFSSLVKVVDRFSALSREWAFCKKILIVM